MNLRGEKFASRCRKLSALTVLTVLVLQLVIPTLKLAANNYAYAQEEAAVSEELTVETDQTSPVETTLEVAPEVVASDETLVTESTDELSVVDQNEVTSASVESVEVAGEVVVIQAPASAPDLNATNPVNDGQMVVMSSEAAVNEVIQPLAHNPNHGGGNGDTNVQYTIEGLIANTDPNLTGSWTTGNLCQGNLDCYTEGDEVPTRVSMDGLVAGETYTIVVQIDHDDGDGNIGYAEVNESELFANVGVENMTITLVGEVPCGSGTTCLNYEITFTATQEDVTIYFDAELSDDAAGWSGASLHTRLVEDVEGGSIGNKELPIMVGQILALPSLTIIKDVVVGDALPSEWCFTISPAINGQTEFCINDATDGGDNVDRVVLDNLLDGSYTIVETTIDGYVFDSGDGTNCTFSGETATAIIGAGDPATSATCTFHNTAEDDDDDDDTALITVVKDVIDENGGDIFDGTEFDVTLNDGDGLEVDTGVISDDATTPVEAEFEVEPGEYSIVETEVDGYNLVSCLPTLVEVAAGDEVTITCTNQVEADDNGGDDVELLIEKTNNRLGQDMFAGQDVLYTLTITAIGGDVNEVVVTDVAPDGFTYRSGTWTAMSSVRGNLKPGTTTEPVYSTTADWILGDMVEGEVVTLTYWADISTTQQPGLYPDLAWTQGVTANASATEVLGNVNMDPEVFVGTEVNIIVLAAAATGVTLAVQNVVLPSTGAETLILIAAIAMLVVGAVMMSDFGKKFKSVGLKFALVAAVLATVGGYGVTQVEAADGDVKVRLEQPKSPNNLNSLRLNFVALDLNDRSVSVQCYKKGPADAAKVLYQTVSTPNNGGLTSVCEVSSTIISTPGTYEFEVVANAGGDSDTSDAVLYTYDPSGPGVPVAYSKTAVNTCSNRIAFTTANDNGETVKVEVYRSQSTNFTADASTRIATVTVGSNQAGSYVDTLPTCGQTYYYAVRAVDNANNASGFTGDTVVNVTTVTINNPNNQTGGNTGSGNLAINVPQAQAGDGEVLGESTTSDTDSDSEDSDSDKAEASDDDSDSKDGGDVKGSSDRNDDKDEDSDKDDKGVVNTTSVVIGIGLLAALGGVAYAVLKRNPL